MSLYGQELLTDVVVAQLGLAAGSCVEGVICKLAAGSSAVQQQFQTYCVPVVKATGANMMPRETDAASWG